MRAEVFLSLLAALFISLFHTPAVAAKNINVGTVDVVIETNLGEITLELYPEAAPVTVANFLSYVEDHRYDGNASFYRTVRMDNQAQNNIKIEVIQGGLGMEDTEFSLPPIIHETTKVSGIMHTDGVISMARLEPGSASSEFFISINDQPALDFGGQRNPDGLGFATFGKVIKGMDVVLQIQAAKTDQPAGQELEYTSGQMLAEPVVINKIYRLESHRK